MLCSPVFKIALWISPEFKVYLIREFQRLKTEEQAQLGWTAKRELSKINYRIHKRTHLPLKYGKPQCRFYRPRHSTGRAAHQAQSDSHSANRVK